MSEIFKGIQDRAKAAWREKQEPKIPRIIVGMGACGIAVGAEQVQRALEQELQQRGIKASVEKTGCIGMCLKEVIVDIINPGGPRVTYGNITPAMVPQLIQDCVVGGKTRPEWAVGVMADAPVDGIPTYDQLPFFMYQQRLVMRNWGMIDPDSIDDYIATGGYSSFVKALSEMAPEQIIEEVKKSNLQGRGGAAFPSGVKWESCRKAPGYPKYILCNGEEGEPGIFKDRRLLEADPHSVLEGMLIAAVAIGSDQGYIYVGGEHVLAIERFQRAMKMAEEYGLLGKNILGTEFSFKLGLRKGAGSYSAGESSALMSSIEGKRAMPRVKLVRSVERGLWAKPTMMNNVESYANMPLIVDKGGAWYAGLGTGTNAGTKIFTLSGNIVNGGLMEVPIGTPLRRLVFDIGGGVPNGKSFKAAQPGGPSGGCLPASLLDIAMDFEPLQKVGSTMGSGGLVIMDEDTCMVDMTRLFLAFDQDESCGRCTSCRIGTQRLYDIVEAISEGEGRMSDLEMIQVLGEVTKEASLCGLGQAAALFALSTVKHFAEEFRAHIEDKHCPAGVCKIASKSAAD